MNSQSCRRGPWHRRHSRARIPRTGPRRRWPAGPPARKRRPSRPPRLPRVNSASWLFPAAPVAPHACGIIAAPQARPQLSISAELPAPRELLELAGHMAQELLHLALQLGITRHGQLDLDHPALPPLAGAPPALARMSGMGGIIGSHEGLALL